MILLDFDKQRISTTKEGKAHTLTFLCQPARKLCQAQGQLPM